MTASALASGCPPRRRGPRRVDRRRPRARVGDDARRRHRRARDLDGLGLARARARRPDGGGAGPPRRRARPAPDARRRHARRLGRAPRHAAHRPVAAAEPARSPRAVPDRLPTHMDGHGHPRSVRLRRLRDERLPAQAARPTVERDPPVHRPRMGDGRGAHTWRRQRCRAGVVPARRRALRRPGRRPCDLPDCAGGPEERRRQGPYPSSAACQSAIRTLSRSSYAAWRPPSRWAAGLAGASPRSSTSAASASMGRSCSGETRNVSARVVMAIIPDHSAQKYETT